MGWLDDINPANLLEEVGLPNPAEDYIKGPERAAEISADATLSTAREAEALNRERYLEALERLDPYMAREARAAEQLDIEMGLAPGEAGTAYMQTPGYQRAINEGVRTAEQTAATGGGTAYGGRRLEAAAEVGQNIQSQYYTNYMNMLSGMAQPATTTNVSSLGMGQAATVGAQNIGAAQSAGQFRTQGAQATQQATGDIFGTLAALFI